MLPIDGINKDGSIINQNEGQYRHAQNILLTRLGNAVAVEEGFENIASIIGKVLLGVAPFKENEFLGFFVNENPNYKVGYIYRFDIEGNYTLVLESLYLKFSSYNVIKSVCTYNPKGELIVAFTDNANPPRILNADNTGISVYNASASDINKLSIFPNVEPPDIYTTDIASVNTPVLGNIKNGTYSFLFAYEIDDYNITNYIGSYGAFTAGKGIEYDSSSGDGIKLTLSGLDQSYDSLRVYAIRSSNGNKTGSYISRIEISSSTVEFVWTGNSIESLSEADLIINPASFKTAKTLTILNNRLHLANLTANNSFDYQPYANSIELEWIRQDLYEFDKDSVADTGLNKFFMPGSTYAFYIAFTLKDGTSSPAFHIPGRVDSTVDDYIYDKEKGYSYSNGGNNIRYCDYRDYSENLGTLNPAVTETSYAHGISLDDLDPPPCEGVQILTTTSTSPAKPNSIIELTRNSTRSVECQIDIQITGSDNWKYRIQDELDNTPVGWTTGSGNTATWNVVMNASNTSTKKNLRVDVETTSGKAFYSVIYRVDIIDTSPPQQGSCTANTYFTTNYSTEDIYFSMTNYPIDYGKMSLTRNEDEFYPLNDSWLVKDKDGNLAGDLKGANVRHHKFPRLSKGNVDQGYWFRLKNIPIPSMLKDSVTGYTVYYAQRDPSDMDVLSNVPALCPNFTNSYGITPGSIYGIRMFDPFLMYKKPIVKNAFLVPELKNDTPGNITPGESLDWRGHSPMGKLLYVPSNTNEDETWNNTEQADNVIFKSDYKLYLGLNKGNKPPGGEASYCAPDTPLDSNSANATTTVSLRQYLPNIYYGFSNLSLVSTSKFHSLLTANFPSTIPSSEIIRGGDTTLSRVEFNYMWKYDTGCPDPAPTEQFTANTLNKYYKKYTYKTLSRIQVDKFGEDLALKPALKFLEKYNGEYMNQYLLNPSYEMVNTFKPAFPFSSLSTYLDSFPNRIARSIVQSSEDTNNIFRKFLSQDYYEMERNRGPLENIEEYNGELLLHTRDSLFKTIGKDILAGSETEVYLGTSDIFSHKPMEYIDSVVGYGGTQHMNSCVLTKMGYFFVNEVQGKCFLLGDTLEEISAHGMHKFFRDNIPFTLMDQLHDAGIQDRFKETPFREMGIGYSAAYDEKYNRIIFSKRGWVLSDSYSFANDTEHKLPYGIENKVYLLDNMPPQLYKNGEFIQLNRNSDCVLDESWTYSYAPGIKRWISSHTYIPTLLWQTKTELFSSNLYDLYKHNSGDNGFFYNAHLTLKTIDSSFIDVVFNQAPNSTKTFYNINWVTESVKQTGGSEFEDTFDEITVFNSYQLSPKVTLVDKQNVRNIEGTWSFNKFRDMISSSNLDSQIIDKQNNISYDLLDTTKSWYAQRRFTDKYIIVRISYDNYKKNTLYLYDISAAFRASLR